MEQRRHNRHLGVDRDVLVVVVAHALEMRAVVRDQRGFVDPAALEFVRQFLEQITVLDVTITQHAVFGSASTSDTLRPLEGQRSS